MIKCNQEAGTRLSTSPNSLPDDTAAMEISQFVQTKMPDRGNPPSSFLAPASLGWLVLLIFIIGSELPAQAAELSPSVEVIAQRMVEANSKNAAGFRPYTVTRNYRLLGNEGEEIKSEVIAEVTFVPPTRKEYTIRQSSGSGMGERVVRRMLTSEAILANRKSSDISGENYTFRNIGEEYMKGRRCYVLDLQPRRKDPHLMVGKVWVDSSTFLILRTEGSPAQNPSWWVRNVHFSIMFDNVEGMWLATGLEASADVRMIGHYKIISRDTGYDVGEMASANPTSSKNILKPDR